MMEGRKEERKGGREERNTVNGRTPVTSCEWLSSPDEWLDSAVVERERAQVRV